MRVFPLFDSMVTDGPTDGWMDSWTDGRTDGRVDKASYRVACLQLKKWMRDKKKIPLNKDQSNKTNKRQKELKTDVSQKKFENR